MTNTKQKKQPVPTHDYRAALQNAVAWLGNRYLLAEPLNRQTGNGYQAPQDSRHA